MGKREDEDEGAKATEKEANTPWSRPRLVGLEGRPAAARVLWSVCALIVLLVDCYIL